jgi:YjjW family glycine radical enzyme activase
MGLVADTIEFSAVDGPGNRFVVFLQGCTFDCLACHNPYTINVCIDCGECIDGCPSGALGLDSAGKVTWDAAVCSGSDHCIAVCRYASSPKARHLAVADLTERIRPAAPFLSGVTVSGGEATMQAPFVRALFEAVRSDPQLSRLTCFVDTNGDAPTTTWDLLAPVMDAAMVDLKCLDPVLHEQVTGASNARTLRSIELLARRGQLHEVRLLMLAGLNDTDDLLAATGAWLAQVDPRMRLRVIGFRSHGIRPTATVLREPTSTEKARYAAVLAAEGDFTIEVV